MRDLALQPPSTGVITFTVSVIALMQLVVWWRDREPGTAWFACAYMANILLAAFDGAVPAGDELPNRIFLPALYAIRIACAFGLVRYLGMPRRMDGWALTMFALLAGAGAVIVAGPPVARILAIVPLLFVDVGFALICAIRSRREPDKVLLLLALGSMFGVASLALALVRGVEPVMLGYDYVWPQAIGFGIVLQVVSLIRRSHQSQLAQARAQRMSNFYAALSQTNQTILHVHEANALYVEICRICVESGHARIACVYVDEGDVAIRVACAGPAEEFLSSVPVRWDVTTPEARASFTVQALRDGVRLVANDYPSESRSGPWRQQALHHGVQAFIWLPLRRAGRVAGVLMLAASEKGFFDPPLLALLDDLTADISFALDNIDREAERLAGIQEIQAGLERFSRLFEAAPVASAIVSLGERRVLAVNAAMCDRHNASREALVGRTTYELNRGIVAEDRLRFYEVLEREGRVRNLVLEMSDEAGVKHPELVNAEPIDYLGQACTLVMQLDITDLRAAEQAREALVSAQAASQAKTDFLSRMSHELRTPLNAVLGFSALLRSEAANRLTATELVQLDHVQQAGWHLLALINDVLDISQIEAGRFGIDTCRLVLAPLINEALLLSQPLASRHAVSLHADCSDETSIAVLVDPTRLRQVLLNLLSNAIKYNRVGGSVQVRARRDGDVVTIEIADTGRGMTPEQLEHIFEPFNRLGREQEGIEGSGIGLALTQQLVHLMRGEVQVDSESGRGTRVRLRLPACDEADLKPTAPAAAATSHSPRGTVLYIEDNPVNTLLVEQLLARWEGVVFTAAEDARTGLERAASLRPDLVLLDMQLPDLDGLEVLRRMRADPALSRLPIVVLSASAMPEDIARAREAGATDYWTKPLDFQRFLADITRLL